MRDPPPVCLLGKFHPQLQRLRVVVVTCTTRGSSVCHLCNCIKNLHCKQVAVTACTTRGLCLNVLELKVNVNGECKCRSLLVRPVASSALVRSQFQKELAVDVVRSRQWGLFVLLSQCKCYCMLSAPNSTLQKNLQWMWVAITSYTIQALRPLCQFFN